MIVLLMPWIDGMLESERFALEYNLASIINSLGWHFNEAFRLFVSGFVPDSCQPRIVVYERRVTSSMAVRTLT